MSPRAPAPKLLLPNPRTPPPRKYSKSLNSETHRYYCHWWRSGARLRYLLEFHLENTCPLQLFILFHHCWLFLLGYWRLWLGVIGGLMHGLLRQCARSGFFFICKACAAVVPKVSRGGAPMISWNCRWWRVYQRPAVIYVLFLRGRGCQVVYSASLPGLPFPLSSLCVVFAIAGLCLHPDKIIHSPYICCSYMRKLIFSVIH